MKKKQWFICLILVGIVLICIVFSKDLWNNNETSSLNNDEIILQEDDREEETEFVPSHNETEDASDTSNIEDMANSNKNRKTDSTEKQESSKNENLDDTEKQENSNDTTNDNKQDTESDEESTGTISTELPFVPFD